MFQDFIEILVLSAIQGISEFLPISSSAHLIIVSSLYDLKASSLLIDISLHLGSLLAIIFFFRKDLFNLKNNHKLLKLIIIGSIPLIIFGYILHSTELINLLRNIKVIAWTTLFFGIILYFADQKKTDQNISSNLNIKSSSGKLIAENWSDLFDGSIYMSLQSAGVTTNSWWSFSTTNGSWDSDSNRNCSSGTSTSGNGVIGSPTSNSSSWLLSNNRACTSNYALICIAKP